VLLAHFTDTERTARAADLGCGAGIQTVLLCSKAPALKVSAIDIDPTAAAQCRQNLAANGYEGRAEGHRGRPAGVPAVLCSRVFRSCSLQSSILPGGGRQVRSRPPAGGGADERTCSFPELCAAAAFFVPLGGRFFLRPQPERLPGLFADLSGAGFAPKLLRLVYPHPDAGASLVLVEAPAGRKSGSQGPASPHPPGKNGAESAEAREIYHRGTPS
jgi:tRNA1(Val) A37 N6-methylase TrmN6